MNDEVQNVSPAVSNRPAGGPDRPRDNDKLAGIQAARGVAALLVVVYHSTRALSLPQYLGYIALGNAFGFGHAGVDFFFVLSGFIITFVHHGDLGRPDRLPRYIWRRITRIYPIFWVVTAIVCMVVLFSPERATRLAPWHLVQSLLLIPEHMDPAVAVAWTLQHEMLFYTAFALAILNRRVGKALVLACVIMVCIGIIAPSDNMWLQFFESPFHLQFLMGIAAARLLARRDLPAPVPLAMAGAAIFLGFGIMENYGLFAPYGFISKLLYGSASVLVLLGIVSAERQRLIHVGSLGLLFGGASYSLYLSHQLVAGLTGRALATVGVLAWLPTVLSVLIMVTAAVVTAVLLYSFVEVPIMTAIRNASRARQAVPVSLIP